MGTPSSQKSVCFVTNDTGLTGTSVSLLFVLDSLETSDWAITVLLPQEDGYLPRQLRQRGIPFYEIPLDLLYVGKGSSLYWLWGVWWRLLANVILVARLLLRLRKVAASVVYVNSAAVRFPIVASIVDYRRTYVWHLREYHDCAAVNELVGVGVKYASDAIIANSVATAEKYRAQEKAVVLANGLPRERESVLLSAPVLSLRRQDRCFTIVYIGQLIEHKGVHHLIEAFRQFSERVANARLLLYGRAPKGQGSYEGRLRRAVEEYQLPAVFKGRVAGIGNAYRRADVVVIPSLREGFGLVALEALAAGRPTIASYVGGLKEVLVKDETTLFVPQGDSESICSRLYRLVKEPELIRNMSRAARYHYLKEYDTRVAGKNVRELFVSLL